MLSVVGHRRLIYPTAYAMVHEGSSAIGGDGADLEADMHNMEVVEDIVKDLYIKNTILTPTEYDTLCIDDKVWDADLCYRFGLVDKIITDPEKLKDWSWVLKLPSRKRQDVKDIKTIRDKSEKILPSRKKRRLLHYED